MKLTPEYLNSLVEKATYAVDGTLTVCTVTLKNGFKLVGKSACLDERIFDAEIGKKLAHADAINQLWALEGYYWASVRNLSVYELIENKQAARALGTTR